MTADMSDVPETCPRCGAEYDQFDFFICGTERFLGGGLERSDVCIARERDQLLAECAGVLGRLTCDVDFLCPICNGRQFNESSHKPDCELAALLAKLREAGVGT